MSVACHWASSLSLPGRRDQLVELVQVQGAFRRFDAVDHEGGGAVDAFVDGDFDAGVERVGIGWVLEAGIDRGLIHAELCSKRQERSTQVLGFIDRGLTMEEVIDDSEIFGGSSAAGNDEADTCDILWRGQEFVQDIANLAGIDVLRLEGRKDIVVEMGAVDAAERGILLDHYAGLWIAQAERIGLRRRSG